MSDADAHPPRLYTDLARYWPVFSPPSDYEPEAMLIAELLDQYLPEPEEGVVQSVLELGAGGGHTLCYLAEAFECVAVDLSENMLDNCQRLNPSVHAVVGDMRTLNLFQAFNAVLLHDAVDYMQTEEDALAAIATCARHLDPGGLLLIGPTYTTECFEDGEAAEDQLQGESGSDLENTALTYRSTVHRTSESTFELHMDIHIQDGNQQHQFVDIHHCGLFSMIQWEKWLTEEGFQVDFVQGEQRPSVLMAAIKQ